MAELAATAGLEVVGSVVQRVNQVNPKLILGRGKLAELEVLALQKNAATLVFDQELTPTQQRNVSQITERKVLDRTQLILDIFAQHAQTREGKLQVEMAQLKYMMPRLVGQNRALSRLTGGIGGRELARRARALRPQLLDRFGLSVKIEAPLDAARLVLRKIAG